MRKLAIGLAALITLMGATVGAHAACDSSGCTNEKVKSIFFTDQGHVFVEMTGDTNFLNCTLVGGRYMTLTPNPFISSNVESMFLDVLFQTQLADNRVQNIRVRQNPDGCMIKSIRTKTQ